MEGNTHILALRNYLNSEMDLLCQQGHNKEAHRLFSEIRSRIDYALDVEGDYNDNN